MKNRYLSTAIGSLAMVFVSATNVTAADEWVLQGEPDVSVDYEGFISPTHSTPYVTIMRQSNPDDIDSLMWSQIKEMIETGQYGRFEPNVVHQACEALLKEHGWLVQDTSIPQTTYPPASYNCRKPGALTPVS